MLGRALRSWRIVGRAFGRWLSPVLTGLCLAILRVGVSVGMALDPLFFPRLRHTRVDRPILIVGNPRSGTTFLHRFLTDNGVGAGMTVWRMLLPSLTLGSLVKPFLPLLERVSPTRHHSAVAHQTSLTSVETDDAGLFFRFHDGFFLYGFIWAWAEEDLRSHFDPAYRDTIDRDLAWLEAIWRRNLVATGSKRVVAKLFSLGPRLPAWLERRPDTRVLYMVRDPLQVLPSAMSLVTGVLESRFGFWQRPEALRRRYLERLYKAFCELYLRFHADWVNGRIDRKKVHIVRFDRLMQDFEGLMAEILDFAGIEATPTLQAAIARTAERQRAYNSAHEYSLEQFGLDEKRIRRDLAPIYETFLDEGAPSDAATASTT